MRETLILVKAATWAEAARIAIEEKQYRMAHEFLGHVQMLVGQLSDPLSGEEEE